MPDATDSGILLISNLPPKALGGIDLLSFTPGPNFRGVKLLPPGFHFVFAASTDSLSLRHGVWFNIREPPFAEPELLVTTYDSRTEQLLLENNEAEKMKLRANIGGLWRESLLAYRQRSLHTKSQEEDVFDEGGEWKEMTAFITPKLLTRITGPAATQNWGWTLSTGSSAKEDADDIPGLNPQESKIESEKELRFVTIDLKQTWPSHATGRERTDAARDRSWALIDVVQNHCAGNMQELLGELQFCFLMVLTLSNYSCLEQWKRILGLVLTCRRAVQQTPQLFIGTLKMLRLQLKHAAHVDGGLFDMSEDGSAFLRGLLRRFRRGLDETSGKAKSDVLDELDELEDFLRVEHGWESGDSYLRKGILQLEDGEEVEAEVDGFDEDDELGDYAPQIVELTAAQQSILGAGDVHLPERKTLPVSHNRQSQGEPAQDGEGSSEDDLDEMDPRY